MNDASADRNLLFGVLAVQMGFISRDDLMAAASAWVENKDQSLGQILVNQGQLSDDDHRLLQQLLAKQIAGHQDDAAQSLTATWDVQQLRKDLAGIDDDLLQASVARLPAAPMGNSPMGNSPMDTSVPSSDVAPAELRFEKQRFHDRGGLGEIHIAIDNQIPREVAIKEIKPRYANVEESRDRFKQEAKITGALEHPGIVPVYAMGQYPDGRPYYAMRFIRGETFSKSISRFHKADVPGRDPGSRRLEFRKLLGQFITVCQTIGYAHSRRVIHRDIKPDNIMLGRYGETLVVDWGLAKKVDEDEAAGVPAAETPLPSAVRGSGSTLPGSVVGTPAYMSPEQAAGGIEQIGPPSDIYSLGATLYRTLTGAFPFQGQSAIEDVTKGRFKPPREVKANVPRALEAICLKAMMRDASDRYETADALAADVERWLADEPVSVYREPIVQRAMRTARHHKVPVSAAAGLLIAAVVVGAAWLHAESKRTSALLGGAQQNLRAGTAALATDDLPKALGFFVEAETLTEQRGSLVAVHADASRARKDVEDSIRMREQFAELLDKVDGTLAEARFRTIWGELESGRDLCRSIYADFIEGDWQQRLDSDELPAASVRHLRESVAEVLMLLARAEVALAPQDEKSPALRNAVGFLDRAEQLRSGQRAVYRLRSDYYQRLSQTEKAAADTELYHRSEPTTAFDFFLEGTDLRANGDPTAAIAQYEKALREDPDHFWSHIMLAVCWIELGQPLQAGAAFDQAIRLRPRYAWAYAGKALALADVGKWDAAHAALNRAESIEPESYAVANNRGAVALAQATSVAANVSPNVKIKLIENAIEQFRRARQLQPRYLGAVSNLGSAHAELAAALQDIGRADEANATVDQAIDYYSQALQRYPRYLPALLGRGATRLRFGEDEAALQDLLAAQAISANDPLVQYRLGILYDRRGQLKGRSTDVAAAVQDHRNAERHFDRALRYRPNWPLALLGRGRARHSLWEFSANHADTGIDPGVAKQALADLNAAEARGSGVLDEKAFADLYGLRADLKAADRREDEAMVDYQLAVDRSDRQASLRVRLGWARLLATQSALDQFDQALASSDELDPIQRAIAHNGRGHALVLLGKDTEAVAAAEAAVQLVEDRWQVLFNAAGIYGVATGIADHERQDELLAEARAARAIELLEKAIAAGLKDKSIIRTDRSFIPLMHREAFQALLE